MKIKTIFISGFFMILTSCYLPQKTVVFETCNLDKQEFKNSSIAFFPVISNREVDYSRTGKKISQKLKKEGADNVLPPEEVEEILQKYNLIDIYYDFINEFFSTSIINKGYLQKLNIFMKCDYFLILESQGSTSGYFKIYIFSLKTYDLKYSSHKISNNAIEFLIYQELKDLGVIKK